MKDKIEHFKAGSYQKLSEYSYFLPNHINRPFSWKSPLTNEIRIGRFLSQVGLCSRRKADTFLREHEVFFKGEKISELNFKISLREISKPVIVDGKEYYWESQPEVVLINKPPGYICSHREYKNQKSVMRFLDTSQKNYFFAGRLDQNSRGLMVFSNDGELIYRLTHPSFRVRKVYHVHLSPPLNSLEIKKALKGVHDQKELLKFDHIRSLQKTGHYEITLHQGKNREIRRMMKRLNRQVLDIQRIRIGSFGLENLKEGESKSLKEFVVEEDIP